MTTFPINYSFEEFNVKGRVISIDNNVIKLYPQNTEVFINYIDSIKDKLLLHKYKYTHMISLSKKSINQLFKYPLRYKRLKEYCIVKLVGDPCNLRINVHYTLKFLPTHIVVHEDSSVELMFTITKIIPLEEKYSFINDKNPTSKENRINAYL